MSTLRLIIADDERPAREFLKSLLRGFEDVEVAGEAETGPDALALIRSAAPDIALLDLQMPEMSGLDVVRRLTRSEMPLVAFVTAYDTYAVQAFEVGAVHYLLKPVEIARLRETIDRARERLENADWRDRETDHIRNAAAYYDEAARGEFIGRIPVKQRGEIYLVPIGEVAAIVADGELLHISTAAGVRHVINFRLKDLELRLDPAKFIRLSRGAIVNMDLISKVSPLPGGTYAVKIKNGQEIVSSRAQSRVLRAKLFSI